MSEHRHTPEPWFEAIPASNFQKGKVEIRGGTDRELICTVASKKFAAIQRANAKLLKAAPNLLEAVCRAEMWISTETGIHSDEASQEERAAQAQRMCAFLQGVIKNAGGA